MEISLLAAGDCGPVHGPRDGFPLERYTELVRPVLAQADLRYVNCMRQYSTRGSHSERAPQVRQPPEMAQIFSDCRFDVANLANNHIYDFGPEAMLDTRALLIDKGLQVMGAGQDLAQAHAPAIIERNGIRVGFLGSTSVGPHGSEAGPGKPGVSAMRIDTHYETHGPHVPVRIRTAPDQSDLKALLDDIARLREQVDIVVVALHYGVIRLPRIIPDYHVAVARACIDAGADLVLGHSPHIPKAIEMYKGKVIFYSVGVFCMTKPESTTSSHWKSTPWEHGVVRNHADLDPETPLMPYGTDARRALLAKAILAKDGVRRVSFLPLMFDKMYRPEPLRSSDARFADALKYMEWVSEGFDHKFTIDGDEVVVSS